MHRLVREVGVEVHVAGEFAGEGEDAVDVRGAVGVVVGAAADEVGAGPECLTQERLGPRRLQDPLLSEGAELEVEAVGVLGP
jgi:hypothetical protein